MHDLLAVKSCKTKKKKYTQRNKYFGFICFVYITLMVKAKQKFLVTIVTFK